MKQDDLTPEEQRVVDIFRRSRRGVEYGNIDLNFKIFGNKLATADANKFVSYKVPKGNIEAITVAGTLIKNTGIAIKQAPGAIPPALTLTFFFKQDGEVERLNIQDFNRENNKER